MSQNTYDSDNDDGDALFDQHETVATMPLQNSPQGGNPSYQNLYTNQNTPAYITQPTQPLQAQDLNPRFSSPAANVQVGASSPFRQPADKSPAPLPRPVPLHNGGFSNRFAQGMAPPGTQFRSPYQQTATQNESQTQQSQLPDVQFSDEELPRGADSSDEDTGPRSGIRKSTFVHASDDIGYGHSPARIAESPRADFSNHVSKFSYNAHAPQKRSADAMADAYSSSRRFKVPKQAVPAEAEPPSLPDIGFEQIPDFEIRKSARNIAVIFPNTPVRKIKEALDKSKGDYNDALEYLAGMDEKDELSKKTKNPEVIEISSDVDELQQNVLFSRPDVKRDVAGTKSINQKWSGAARRPSEVDKTLQQPQKRKLVRNKVASPVRERSSSPPVQRQSNQRALPPRRQAITVESDEDEGIVLPDGDDTSSEAQEEERPADSEQSFLEFLNSCKAEDLMDMANQPIENINTVLDKRPFRNLDQVRKIYIENKTTTKKGNTKTTKKQIGDRLVDACLTIWEGYLAVDELVAKCEEIKKPLDNEMKRLGFNAFGSSGELELVDLEAHDSGIGTPSSSAGSADGDNDEIKIVKSGGIQKPKRKLLAQPAIMSEDVSMKDYQIAGLNWLSLLWNHKTSGILADDMGLGKTCQVIALFAHLKETGVSGPHLVVVPGSTLENWLREFHNFCPKLSVEPYYGSQADRVEARYRIETEIKNIDVIVTTYDMARARDDGKFLRKLSPVVCVFDEGHALKNSKSQKYKSLMRINCQFRLLLTGTPLQNNLQELISLLSFIMPNVFHGRMEDLDAIFKLKASTSANNGNISVQSGTALLSAERINRARSMMTPFILRRKKQQVLKHLPTKTCKVEFCDMTASQKEIYESIEKRARKVFSSPSSEGDDEGGKMTTTSAVTQAAKTNILMELRKASIHPLLFRRRFTDTILRKIVKSYLKDPDCPEKKGQVNKKFLAMSKTEQEDAMFEHFSAWSDLELDSFCRIQFPATCGKYALSPQEEEEAIMDSGKITSLLSILRRNISNGCKTLVFSQFTQVLSILESLLSLPSVSIAYSRLDGSTPMAERQDLIDQFSYDKSIHVFMLSTKAGGAGINLAAANKVVVFDMGFNPQEDIQAENRAHRVGQVNEVEVVRLVSKGGVEEGILRLAGLKLVMGERVAGVGNDDAAADGNEGEETGEIEASAVVGDEDEDGSKAEEKGVDLVGKMMMDKLKNQRDLPDDNEKNQHTANKKEKGRVEIEIQSSSDSDSGGEEDIKQAEESKHKQSSRNKKDDKKKDKEKKSQIDKKTDVKNGKTNRGIAKPKSSKNANANANANANGKKSSARNGMKQTDLKDQFRKGLIDKGVNVGGGDGGGSPSS